MSHQKETSISIVNGGQTIGDIQVVIEGPGRERLIFDTGRINDLSAYFIEERPGNILHDQIAAGNVAHTPNLYYRNNTPEHIPPIIPETDGPVAVANSHSHLDHTRLSGEIVPEVPLYMTPTTARIVRVHSDAGKMTRPFDREITERFQGTETFDGDEFSVGQLRARFIEVDHDVPGSNGILVETPQGAIAFTGDIRLNGNHPERTLAFAKAVKDAGTKVLITESVMVRKPQQQPRLFPEQSFANYREDEVEAEFTRILQDTSGLAVTLLMPDNGERVEEAAKAAQNAGRLFVSDLDGLAYTRAALSRSLNVPYGVYLTEYDQQRIDSGTLPKSFLNELSDAPQLITSEHIANHPENYLLRLEFKRFNELYEMRLGKKEGVLIHSAGLPIGPYDPGWPYMQQAAKNHNLRIESVYSSGHAQASELGDVAEQTGAPIIIPVHGFSPEYFPTSPEKLFMPERGIQYPISVFDRRIHEQKVFNFGKREQLQLPF